MSRSEIEQTCLKFQLDGKVPDANFLSHFQQIPAIIKHGNSFRCQRCHNHDPRCFPILNSDQQMVFCSECIMMGRLTNKDVLYYMPDRPNRPIAENQASKLTWQGTLSEQQAQASQEALNSLTNPSCPHLIHAVTGAGKTEMLFPVIDQVLQKNGKVAIASPRVDVCLELAPRIEEAFQKCQICLLYGSPESAYIPNDIMVSTTHQLLRFKEAFDLLVVDEVDAFPYLNNRSLHYAVARAVKSIGKLLYLTATPDKVLEQAIKQKKITASVLPARFHGYPLVEPKFSWLGEWQLALKKRKKRSRLMSLLKYYMTLQGPKLIFMANIHYAKMLAEWLKEIAPLLKVEAVYASDPLRKDKVLKLRKEELDVLVTTTILERGVTFTNCQVLILGAEDPLFDKSSLVQMSGRVGRKATHPKGILIYGHCGITREMRKARNEIRQMNRMARQRGLLKESEV